MRYFSQNVTLGGDAANSRRNMTRVVVTGGSGNFGRACVNHLVQAGWDVISVDQRGEEVPGARFVQAELTDLGQVV